jgi:hypothetical protein
MMRCKKLLTFIGAVLLVLSASLAGQAQSSTDLRINEILVYNDSNYVDDFGKHSPWIEIFNSAYNSVDVGGLYLTDDLSNPTKYPIAKGQQSLTRIPKRSYIVFWADNKPTHGILHLNFTLEPGKTIALFDANGRTLIDSLTIPNQVSRDVSYGRAEDGGPDWKNLPKTTPNSNNNTEPVISSGDEFAKFDPSGGGMAMIAMGVVFSGLAALYFFFKMTSRVLAIDVKKQLTARSLTKAKAGRAETADAGKEGLEITGEINAALAMTLYLYSSELHDAENTVLTINKVSRTYSPWSSKIYGLRKLPK